MKKQELKQVVVALCAMGILAISSCGKENDGIQKVQLEEKSTELFLNPCEKAGMYHNLSLIQSENYFYDEDYSMENLFNATQVVSKEILQKDSSLCSYAEVYLLSYEDIGPSILEDTASYYTNTINAMNIASSTKIVLVNIINKIKMYEENTLLLKNSVKSIEQQIHSGSLVLQNNDSLIVYAALAVARYSADYWDNYDDAEIGSNGRGLKIAADVVGAVAGAVGGAISGAAVGLSTGNPVVAGIGATAGAITGAVNGSTGCSAMAERMRKHKNNQ
ncbi:MAG: glycine zipper family protein [Bacteroidales bacterium]|nr:glycine zipper family protein [Bacteroidales bacterium]